MNAFLKKAYVFFKQHKINSVCKKKIRIIKQNTNNLNISKEIERSYVKLWKPFDKKPDLNFLRTISSISGIQSHEFVPENIYYGKLEPVLNNKTFAYAYSDKNLYEHYLYDHRHLFPNTILRCIWGAHQDKNYKTLSLKETLLIIEKLIVGQEYIVKPSIETSGGRNILLVKKTKAGFETLNKAFSHEELLRLFKKNYNGNYIFQKKITQHSFLSEFNSSSVNIIRAFTYRSVINEQVRVLSTYMRFGKEGLFVDGLRHGGKVVGISESGKIVNYAIGIDGKKYRDLPVILKYQNTKFPLLEEIKKQAILIAPLFKYSRILGFDFTIDSENKIRLIEVNCKNIGIINQQMNTGPLFKEYTKEIIDHCLSNKKAISIHFYV